MTDLTVVNRRAVEIRRGAFCATALCGLMTVIAAPQAQAQTTYTSSAAFLPNVQSGYYTETFTGSSFVQQTASYQSNGFGYTVSSSGKDGVYSDGTFVSTEDNNLSNLAVTFTTGNVTAVGGNFYNVDINNNAQTTPVTLTVNFATGNPFSTTFSPTSASTFFGITSTSVITSIVESAPQDGTYASLDNLTTGARFVASATSPEPGVLPLLGSAVPLIGAFVAVRRRRRGLSA